MYIHNDCKGPPIMQAKILFLCFTLFPFLPALGAPYDDKATIIQFGEQVFRDLHFMEALASDTYPESSSLITDANKMIGEDPEQAVDALKKLTHDTQMDNSLGGKLGLQLARGVAASQGHPITIQDPQYLGKSQLAYFNLGASVLQLVASRMTNPHYEIYNIFSDFVKGLQGMISLYETYGSTDQLHALESVLAVHSDAPEDILPKQLQDYLKGNYTHFLTIVYGCLLKEVPHITNLSDGPELLNEALQTAGKIAYLNAMDLGARADTTLKTLAASPRFQSFFQATQTQIEDVIKNEIQALPKKPSASQKEDSQDPAVRRILRLIEGYARSVCDGTFDLKKEFRSEQHAIDAVWHIKITIVRLISNLVVHLYGNVPNLPDLTKAYLSEIHIYKALLHKYPQR